MFCSDLRRANKRLKSTRSLSSRGIQRSSTTGTGVFAHENRRRSYCWSHRGAALFSHTPFARCAGSTTCAAMREAGPEIVGTTTTGALRSMARRGLAMIAITVSFVALHGTAVRTSAAPRSATESAPAIGATPLVSRSPGRLSHRETGEKVHSILESLCR